MTWTARVWEYDKSVKHNIPPIPITIEACRQRDNSILYAVRQMGYCLNRTGEWEYEPIPSDRDEAFMARCRFDDWTQAALTVERHCRNGKGHVRC